LLQKMAVKAAVNAGRSASTVSSGVHASTTCTSSSTIAVVAILMLAGVTKLLSGDVFAVRMFGALNVEVAFVGCVGMLALGTMYVIESVTEKKFGKPKMS
jgi:hypothetical protein